MVLKSHIDCHPGEHRVMKQADSKSLLASFSESERAVLLDNTRLACWVSLVLVPAGITLDYFAYPQFFRTFLLARIVCDLAIVPILLLLHTNFASRSIRWISALWAVTPMWMICWMIYRSEGSTSPYYAGLSLMLIATCQLLPNKFFDILIYSLVVLGSYAVACVFNANQMFDLAIFYNNLYFLLLTCIVCVTTSLFFEQRSLQEFRLRYQLDQSNRKLEEMDRLKSSFFANISHELRTPLTLVLSPVENLLQSSCEMPDSIRRPLTLVQQNALRLLRLINDLLDIVRLEEGKRFVDLKPIDLVVLLSALVDSVRQLALQKEIKIHCETDRQPVIVEGDTDRLEKVFLNLLSNAVKFTPAGGAISVGWKVEDDMAVISITDTGIGIAKDDIKKIFQRFGQVGDSLTRNHQGLGIGLALTRDLIVEHKGTLEVRSEPGEGSVFDVTIPLSTASRVEPDTQAVDPLVVMFKRASHSVLTIPDREIAGDEPAISVLDGSQCVLHDSQGDVASQPTADVVVVDDEDDMRTWLIHIFREKYAVRGLSSGRDVLQYARKCPPKVIVLDEMMPEMSGLEVARELRADAQTKASKILMLTAKPDEKSKIDALRAGVDDYMNKPFLAEEVLSRVVNLARTYDLEASLRQANLEIGETLAQLQATEAQLVQSEKINAIGTLAAGLLHEINNPLNFTLMAVETLANTSDPDDADLQGTLEDISGGMTRISTIVSDLRSFAYPEQADLKTEFSASDVVESAVRFTSHETRDCKIETNFEDAVRAVASHTHVSHVLINLIVNAKNAIERSGSLSDPTIKITTSKQAERVFFRVEDNGCGIPEEILNRIFEPFFTTGEIGKGMGLGLSICHTIVKNHGGTFRVESEVEKGSVFQFDVPSSNTETV